MTPSFTPNRRIVMLLALAALLFALARYPISAQQEEQTAAAPQEQETPAASKQTPPAKETADAKPRFVGSSACAKCHRRLSTSMEGSAHGTSCEGCHGPGSAHVANYKTGIIRTFRTEPAAERSNTCLVCHNRLHGDQNFRRSEHQRRDVACDQCHSAGRSPEFHSMRRAREFFQKTEASICLNCHADQRASFALPFRHPVEDGFMGCSSCHEPHGAYTARQMRTNHTDSVCGKCHQNVQGPFVFEHPSGRAAGCESCHTPHGSTNPRMLLRPQVQFLCLECHANTPPSHNLTNTQYQNCTVCHNRIHGSNLNRLLFR